MGFGLHLQLSCLALSGSWNNTLELNDDYSQFLELNAFNPEAWEISLFEKSLGKTNEWSTNQNLVSISPFLAVTPLSGRVRGVSHLTMVNESEKDP